eukprot:1384334-Pleurochrysis_carterae.AAC.1
MMALMMLHLSALRNSLKNLLAVVMANFCPAHAPDEFVVNVGSSVREVLINPNMFQSKGLIYSLVGDKYGVAFDDLNWRPYSTKPFPDDFTLIAAENEIDMLGPAPVRSVLIGRKGSFNLPC